MKKLFGALKENKILAALFVIACSITFYMLLSNLSIVGAFLSKVIWYISPVLVGAVIAYLINPICGIFTNKVFKKLKNRKTAHVLGVICGFVSSLFIISMIISMIIPQIAASIKILAGNMNGYVNSLTNLLNDLENKYEFFDIDIEQLMSAWNNLFSTVTTWVSENIETLIGISYQVGTSVFNGIIAFVISLYMLLDKENLKLSVRRISAANIEENKLNSIRDFIGRADFKFMKFLSGNLLDSLMIGAANFIFMIILRMPYALLISVVVGVTNFIPTFGPIIGAVPCIFILLMIEPVTAFWFLVWTIVLQTIDANIIKPVLFGDTTGLRPVWVLVAIIVGGRVLGFLGMIIGIPVFAIISEELSALNSARLEKRGYDTDGNKRTS